MTDVKGLSEKLKQEAVSLGLCREWTEDWDNRSDRDGLVEKFVRGIDFCIAHDWPSVKEMKRGFGGVMQRHGVYADENVECRNAPFVVLNGCCVADLCYDGTGTGDVYVRHDSECRIKVRGLSRVFVSVYDTGTVNLDCEEGTKCFVYVYGGGIGVIRGDVCCVTVRDRRKEVRDEPEQ